MIRPPIRRSEHVETTVPVGGEIDFDVDLGLGHEKHTGVLAVGGTRSALMTESSKSVRLSSWLQVVTGLAVAGGGFQSRNCIPPPPCPKRAAAKTRISNEWPHCMFSSLA
jgi:hypothetical protein